MEKNLHKSKGGARMCQICLTLHPASGVSMVSIQWAKSAEDHYNTVGTYLCSDLTCSDYTLGRKKPEGSGRWRRPWVSRIEWTAPWRMSGA